jgi:hypothetical protein
MPSIELLNDFLKTFYILEKTKTDWKDYGIIEMIVRDKYDNKRYKAVVKDNEYVERSIFFVTMPTKISQEIAHELAQKFNMIIPYEHDNNGYSYFVKLVSRERKGVGEITAKVVTGEEEKYLEIGNITWSIEIDNYLSHYTFKITFLIEQACTVGLLDGFYPRDIKEVTIRKTYNIEKLKKTIFEMAEEYKKKFDNFVVQESC